MNWTIEFTGIMFSVGLTGNILFLLWYLLCIPLQKWGYGKWCRMGLWAVEAFYLIPVVYMGMWYCGQNGRWGGVLFWPTQTILDVTGVIFWIWAIGAGILCSRLVVSLIVQYKRNGAQIPCEKELQIRFAQVCREVGIKPGSVALVWDYRAKVPAFTGILHPRVTLPVQEFTAEQLRVVLLHELTHYKQGDMYLLLLTLLVQIVQWFCSFVWVLGRKARLYMEYACDEKVCGRAGGRKPYFDTIFDLVCASHVQKSLFSMYMTEDKHELVRRKKYMKDAETRKKKPIVCAALSVLLVMCCSVTILAASDKAGDQYREWYRGTVVEIEEPYEPKIYEEYTDHGPAENIKVETGETDQISRSMANISWTVGSNTSKSTAGFSVKSGQTISISIMMEPNMKNVKAGIVDSSGNRTYITGNGAISHNFEIKSADTYKVFVENTNASSVEVKGYYSVR